MAWNFHEESDDLILNTKIMYKYKTSENIIKNFIRNKLDNFENVNIDMKIPAENLAIFCCDDIKLSCIGNRTGNVLYRLLNIDIENPINLTQIFKNMIYDCCNNMGNVESFDLTFKVQTNEHCLNIIFFLPFEKKDDNSYIYTDKCILDIKTTFI